MKAIIVSDLHIGSRFFSYRDFMRFLARVPRDHELILNGDILDDPNGQLNSPHQCVLELIEQLSCHQKVVWIKGNHENGYTPGGFKHVLFKRTYALENRILIVHGDNFDDIMPKNMAFIKAFKWMHDARVRLGAKPVHVAKYAKKWGIFYRVLCKNVMNNAVRCALENRYEAVICGHTHYPEDRSSQGVRYVNTGAWTEAPIFYAYVNANEMELKRVDDLIGPFRLNTHPAFLPPTLCAGTPFPKSRPKAPPSPQYHIESAGVSVQRKRIL